MKAFFFLIAFTLSILTACNQSQNDGKAALKIAFDQEPRTLDPRQGTDLQTANVLQMLYEGLMRIDYHGQVVPGIAESYDLSSDLKTYTFILRETTWSDGTALTAKDFEETWKSLLNPSFPAPNAYQFYYIKGAKAYKEGKGKIEDVGIKSLDPKHLVVELESPAPFFPKLVASFFYLPVSSELRVLDTPRNVISNGPFKLQEWKHNDELVLIKNPLYWDSKVVSLEKVLLTILDENTSYKMFEMGQLDRVGSPTATLPQDAIAYLRQTKQLKMKPAAATHWFRFNTEAAPMNHIKMRKAFNAALSRQSIVEHVTQGNQTIAMGIVPSLAGWSSTSYYRDNDTATARQLFQEALEEMHLDKEQLPSITLTYAANDREHKIAQAVQQQWSKAFGIPIRLQSQEAKMFSENVLKGNYQISTGSWYADFSDPINFLEVFKFKTNSSNRTKWENSEYIRLLDASASETDPALRFKYLMQAEAILMEHMPVAPLFASFNYLENENTGGMGLSDLGIIDLKYAFIEDVAESAE